MYYILNDQDQPVAITDSNQWHEWMRKARETERRRVAEATLDNGTWISTVFLGIDHNFAPNQDPILWETMVFRFEHDLSEEEYCARYSSLTDAQEGHKKAVEWAREHCK